MIYYHNPRCSKSREGLQLLIQNGHDPEIKEYLKTGFEKKEVEEIFKKLGKGPLEIIRKKENIFKELELKDRELSDSQWADTICEHPVLMERPILVTNDGAVIGRPPELILEFLG